MSGEHQNRPAPNRGRLGRLQKKGAFALFERRHLPMRQRTLGNRANPTTFEDEAELITDLVTDGTMKTVPFTAVHEVTRISSEGYTVETWLEGARYVQLYTYVYCTHMCTEYHCTHMYTYKCILK